MRSRHDSATIDDGIAAMTRPGRVIAPRRAARPDAADVYARNRKLYPASKPFRLSA